MPHGHRCGNCCAACDVHDAGEALCVFSGGNTCGSESRCHKVLNELQQEQNEVFNCTIQEDFASG